MNVTQLFNLLQHGAVYLPMILGLGVSQVVALVTHDLAPGWLKSGLVFLLSTLSGVVGTVTYGGGSLSHYLSAIGLAWMTASFSHYVGLTQAASNLTAGSGLGAPAESALPDAADLTAMPPSDDTVAPAAPVAPVVATDTGSGNPVA